HAAPVDRASLDLGQDLAADLPPPPFLPSHVMPADLHPEAQDLRGVTAIDTSTATITPMPSPQALLRVTTEGYLVLSVNNWLVDQPITITGTRPLIVVAAGTVDVENVIHAHAVGI